MNIANNITESLGKRYTSKAFKPNTKIDENKYNLILEAVNMAPTSFGVQPFKIIEIKDQKTKDEILPIAFNQPQINTCDTILVFAIELDTDKSLEEYKSRVVSANRLDKEKATGFISYINSSKEGLEKAGKSIEEWKAKQAYLALGYASMTAAMLEVESACMEGFIAPQLDALLDLESKGLKSVVILCLGVGAEDDANKTNPKVRKTIQELVIS